MTYKHILTIYMLLVLFASLSFAQNKVLTLDQASFGMQEEFLPAKFDQLKWMGASDAVAYVRDDSLYKAMPKASKPSLLTSLTELSELVEAQGGAKLERFPTIEWANEGHFWFINADRIWEYSVAEKALSFAQNLLAGASNYQVSPRYDVSQIKAGDLYLLNEAAKESSITPISKHDDANIISGSPAYRYEFGIRKGVYWNKSGSKLAFYVQDLSAIQEYPFLDIKDMSAEIKKIKYPFAGKENESVQVKIYNTETKETIALKTGNGDKFLTNITWGPGGNFIYVVIVDRAQENLQLKKYDANTGEEVATVLKESNTRYLEPEHGPMFLPKSTHRFIWQSKRNGHNHLYLYSTDGKLIQQITNGRWDVTSLLGVDPAEKKVFYISTEASPLERQVYSFDLKKSVKTKLTKIKGTHEASLSASGKYILDEYSNTTTPRVQQIIDVNSAEVSNTLLVAPNPFKGYRVVEMEINRFKTSDGHSLFYRLIKPLALNMMKKYPAIVYVYGGPKHQEVRNKWMGGANLFLYYLAQNGYVVFTVDGHGSANRGVDFEQTTYHKLGQEELKDQMEGVKFLKKLQYVNPYKIGVYGWSFGGFMTVNMMTKEASTFKVGVAGAPVTDWNMYEVMYTERYMGKPADNKEGYHAANLSNFASKLQGHLLMVHGTHDDIVVPQHTFNFVDACIKADKQIDMFLYPGHSHHISGKDKHHLNRKILQYFEDYLK